MGREVLFKCVSFRFVGGENFFARHRVSHGIYHSPPLECYTARLRESIWPRGHYFQGFITLLQFLTFRVLGLWVIFSRSAF